MWGVIVLIPDHCLFIFRRFRRLTSLLYVTCKIFSCTRGEQDNSSTRQLTDTGFGSLVILDVARCYLWLSTLYINIKIGKNSC